MIWTWKKIVPAIVLCALAVAYGIYAETSARTPDMPAIYYEQYESELIRLDREAIALAYKQQVQSLFLTWMKDHTGQPERAIRGINAARKAYADSMTAIDKRDKRP